VSGQTPLAVEVCRDIPQGGIAESPRSYFKRQTMSPSELRSVHLDNMTWEVSFGTEVVNQCLIFTGIPPNPVVYVQDSKPL